MRSREIVTRGHDFITMRLSGKAPKLKSGNADRLETWQHIGRKKAKGKLRVEDCEIHTHGDGRKETVMYWRDNNRLAEINGCFYELVASKAITRFM